MSKSADKTSRENSKRPPVKSPAQSVTPIQPHTDSGKLTPRRLRHLQNTVGNQTVLRLIDQGSLHRDAIQRDPDVQREVDEETMSWAAATNTSVETIQDAVRSAATRLNTDAGTAITHIEAAQGQYNDFERKYEEAVVSFVDGVEQAQAKEREMRENVKFVATTALAVAAPTASQMYQAIDGTITKTTRVASILSTGAPAPAPQGRPGGSSPGMAARREDRVDWSELLTTTLTAFRTTLQNNASLNELAGDCIEIVRFLNSVQTGRYTGDNPRSDPLAVKAQRLVDNLSTVLADLRSIGEGTVSGPTETLKDQITERLSGLSKRKLEQDIAIRWMAGLGSHELDNIDLADAYLRQIGVIDSEGNRLGYDTGAITTSDDERIIHWRASWEATAMSLVGSTVTWLGNPFMPPPRVIDDGTRCIEPRVYSGMIRDGRNREWNVDVPQGAPHEGGGDILLTGYTVDHRDSSGWEWSRPGDLRQQLQWEIRFTGQPVGRLGGGAPPEQDIIHAPD